MLAYWSLGLAGTPPYPPLIDWTEFMTRFSIVSNVGNLFGLLVLRDGQVWNWSTNRAEQLPADNTPTIAHLVPIPAYKPTGPLVAFKRVTLAINPEILAGGDFVVLSGNADGTNLAVLDSWPCNYLDLPWIGRGGWGGR